MAKIFYSLSGEGRGHSVRAKTIVDALLGQHELVIYTYGMAYQFLKQTYRDTNVAVRLIPGLRFHYNDNKQLVYYKTLWHGIKYLSGMRHLVERLAADIEREAPDLVITDFEPALPRAARKTGVPSVAINHQYCLSMYKLSSVPSQIRFHAAYLGQCANLFSVGQIETIVSAFFFPPLLPEFCHAHQVGVMIRDEIARLQTEDRGYLLVYLKKFIHKPVLRALQASGFPVRIYGLGAQPSSGNLRFFEIDNERFVADLAGCRALVATGGNQLLGEVSYLRKPILTIPEPGNWEQYVNAHFLEQSGGGRFYEVGQIEERTIGEFAATAPQYVCRTPQELIYGNRAAIEVVEASLAVVADDAAAGKRLSA